MNKKVLGLINQFAQGEISIDSERKEALDELAVLIRQELEERGAVDIIVICTHNSRRSQLGEMWINTLAHFFNIDNLTSYSGGMEDTAFNYRMVNAVQHLGFDLAMVQDGDNPQYIVKGIGKDDHIMFSKAYDHPVNPQSEYIALMVCDHADENCPIVHGMNHRIPLRYKDPKAFDDTELEEEAYQNKVREIGSEIFYLLEKCCISDSE